MKSKRIIPQYTASDFLKVKDSQQVRQLHRQYLEGEITFRRMTKKLGLEYRQLYALLEELNLPLA